MEIKTPNKEYHRDAELVYSCQYHVIFCPKYRRKVLVNGIDEELKKMKGYEKLDLPDGNGRYHACFSTNVDFENIIARYKQEFEEHEINMYQFKNELMNFKWAWDQKTAAGVVLYIYNNPKFKEFIGKSELKDKFPEAYGGRVKEDYSPRLKAHAGTGRK